MDLKAIVSIAPLGVVAVGAIFSYATLSASAESNSEDIRENKTQISANSTQLQELDKKVTVVEMQLQCLADDVADMKSDTKTILTLISNGTRRVPTE